MALPIPDFYRGDSIRIDVELKIDGVPENIVGTDIWFTMKPEDTPEIADSVAPLQVRYTVPNNANALVGKASFMVHTATFPSLVAGAYRADLQRVRAGAPPDVWTFHRQRLVVLADVTRSTA